MSDGPEPRRTLPPGRDLRVDPARLERRIGELAAFGGDPDGSGVTRVAFGAADVAARTWVVERMREAGLEPRGDAAGNLFGRRDGGREDGGAGDLPPIWSGSHIDTVPHGGRFDGSLGVLAALECAQVLHENGVPTRHPFEVVVFADEEDGLIGSRALLGRLDDAALAVVGLCGLSIADGLRAVGGDPSALSDVIRHPGDVRAFLELHVEQGAVLADTGCAIGVVEGIVGIRWFEATVAGTANHAGTTPMDRRKDALVAAAELVLAVERAARDAPLGRPVATVGRISAEPGAPNVIPGRVALSVEIRAATTAGLDRLEARVREAAAGIAGRTGCAVRLEPRDVATRPAPMDERVRQVVADSARRLGLDARSMPSGAGHDAQHLAEIAPTGMIFVPSERGISHSPDEFTTTPHAAQGADVLLQTVLAIDAGALDRGSPEP